MPDSVRNRCRSVRYSTNLRARPIKAAWVAMTFAGSALALALAFAWAKLAKILCASDVSSSPKKFVSRKRCRKTMV